MSKLQMLKKALISYVANSIKAIWSDISYPLMVEGNKNCDLADYRIHGNSVQDGTPTPENPIAIQSVGELVKEGENTGKYKVSVKVSGNGKEEIVDIFLDEPLRKVGDYADIINFSENEVIRKTYQETITDVTGVSSSTTSYKRFTCRISQKPLISTDGEVSHTRGIVISDKFKSTEEAYNNLGKYGGFIIPYITTSGASSVALTFTKTNVKTVEAAQEAIGDGFDVCYILATPVSEKINLPKLPQYKGTTIYEVLTDTPPSGIEVCYYG